MATQRTSFAKMQRDRAKKAKAAMKRERRQTAREESEHNTETVDHGGELSPQELLEQVANVQAQFEAKEITFEEYEEKKLELLARLPMD
jgi:hypothetical protein